MSSHPTPDVNLLNHYSGQVVNAAMKVHSQLGPGLFESTYQACMLMELQGRGINVESEVTMPVNYNGSILDLGYRIDILVEKMLIVELKAVRKIVPLHQAQLLAYLKLSGLKLGLLINFNTVSLKTGIHRMVNRL